MNQEDFYAGMAVVCKRLVRIFVIFFCLVLCLFNIRKISSFYYEIHLFLAIYFRTTQLIRQNVKLITKWETLQSFLFRFNLSKGILTNDFL